MAQSHKLILETISCQRVSEFDGEEEVYVWTKAVNGEERRWRKPGWTHWTFTVDQERELAEVLFDEAVHRPTRLEVAIFEEDSHEPWFGPDDFLGGVVLQLDPYAEPKWTTLPSAILEPGSGPLRTVKLMGAGSYYTVRLRL